MYFEVRIFADEAAMREHYRRSSVLSRTGEHDREGWLEDAAALTAPRSVCLIERDGTERWHPCIGIILLPLGHVTTRVVSHELVHAALTYYRERRWRGGQPGVANFGEAVTWREEALGHIYCEFMVEMSNALHDRGLWS